MTPAPPEDEEALEAACRAGQPSAVQRVIALLASDHPYTRARAAEMLARCPAPVFAAWAEPLLHAGRPGAIAWYAIAEHARVVGHLPAVAGLAPAVVAVVAEEPSGDEASELLDVIDWLPADERRALLRSLAEHPDAEVGVEAAWRLDELGEGLAPAVLARLREVPLGGGCGDMAAVLRASHGDREALPLLVDQVLRQGFLAWRALAVLEEQGDAAIADALRPVHARFWPGVLAPRAAAAAARIGCRDAERSLRRMAGSWRSAIRSGARAEQLRLGTPAEVAAWVARAESLSAEEVVAACGALGRRGDAAGEAALRELVLRDPRADVRALALEALSDAGAGALKGLRAALEDGGLWTQELEAIVREAANG